MILGGVPLGNFQEELDIWNLLNFFLSNCAYFEKFPYIIEGNMRHLRELHLVGTANGELPISIGYLECLEILDLHDCRNLHKFPQIERNMEIIEKLYLNKALL